MRRSGRFRRVKAVAGIAESQAEQALRLEQANLQAAAKQQRLLADYREEYSERLRTIVQQTFSAAAMVNFQRFVTSLGRAIKQQEEDVSRHAARVDEKRAEWRDCWNRKNSLDRMQATLDEKESRDLEVLEQKDVNDMTVSRFFVDR